MEYLALILLIPVAVLLFFWFTKLDSLLQEQVEKGLSKLNKTILKEEKDNFDFYTDGHPYVWVKSDYDSCVQTIIQAKYAKGIAPDNFTIKKDLENKAIYFLHSPTKKFKMGDLKHYKEWDR